MESHLLQMRGLKLCFHNGVQMLTGIMSHLLQMRGLKLWSLCYSLGY